MPLPLLLVPGIATAAYGLYKGGKAIVDNSDASDLNESAKDIIESANKKVDEQKDHTGKTIEDYGSRKLRAFAGPIEDFIKAFGQLKNVEVINSPELEKLKLGGFSKEEFKALEHEYSLLSSSGLGLGAGLSGGAAVAFGAYGGTMALATASTGTAISALSGAAATNATLAWLGGGSLAAGGAGMAGGMMVLGGLVAGPALAIFGAVVGSKAEKALADARSNMETARTFRDEAELTVEKLSAIAEVTAEANTVFSKITTQLRRSNSGLKKLILNKGVDYSKYDNSDRDVVFTAVKFAQLVKAMIDTPILDEEGNLLLSTEKTVKQIAEQV